MIRPQLIFAGALGFACGSVLAFAAAGLAADDLDDATIIEILAARDKSVASISARVEMWECTGPGLSLWLKMKRDNAAWLRTVARDEKRARKLDEMVENFTDPPSVRQFGRYFRADAPVRVRIAVSGTEFTDASGVMTALSPGAEFIHVYTGDRWKTFVPSEWSNSALPVSSMNIHKEFRLSTELFEVALGTAMLVHPMWTSSVDLSAEAIALRQVPWSEVTRLLGPVAEADRMPPDPAVPWGTMIELSPPGRHGADAPVMPHLRIWLDAEHGYCPRRVQLDSSWVHPRTGARYWNPDLVVEWDQIADVPGAGELPMRCAMHRYSQCVSVDEGAPEEQWPMQTCDTSITEFRFSDVRVGDALDDALFDVVAPAGTNVIDEVGNSHYLVGSAGEELRKTALELRRMSSEPPDRAMGSAHSGRMLLIYAVVVGVIAALLALYFRHLKSKAR